MAASEEHRVDWTFNDTYLVYEVKCLDCSFSKAALDVTTAKTAVKDHRDENKSD